MATERQAARFLGCEQEHGRWEEEAKRGRRRGTGAVRVTPSLPTAPSLVVGSDPPGQSPLTSGYLEDRLM